MDDTEKYALYQQANESGEPCEICGWKDGDGTRTCFSSNEIGIVKHQNSEQAVAALMTPEQRSLYLSRSELVFISEELREQSILQTQHQHLFDAERHRALNTGRPFTIRPDGTEVTDEEWIARYRANQATKGLATDPKYAGWMHEHWWVPVKYASTGYVIPEDLRGPQENRSGLVFTSYMTHVYEPHSCGKGHAYQITPYHYGCTGCSVEVKLWEFGVDYDMG